MPFQPYNHKQELSKPERFVGGHRLCAGCGAGIVCRGIMRALDEGDRARWMAQVRAYRRER